ncbi:period circadian protein homolog 2 [Rhinoraja longicauda]
MATYSEPGFQEAELVLHPSSGNIQDQTPDQAEQQMHDDVNMKSNGSSGIDSNGNEFSDSSSSTASHNEKDSALHLDSVKRSQSSNSQGHCSSNGLSLISASSEQDNLSSSGCSSDQSAKAKTQKELLKAFTGLKRHLPSEKMAKGKSRTLSTLKYALECIKQVQANEEHYKFLMNDDTESNSLSMNSFTIDEVENIISEYTSKNADIFAVTVSLITGQIVHISDQAAYILNCNNEVFKSKKFTELLAPQDIGVFYSSIKPSQLPLWNMCQAAGSSPFDCMQEKSFFCRISGNQQRDRSTHYYPFQMTPYLTKVRASDDDDDQLCCLMLAERVHSGYEAPRIPHDKRVFTTTHSPSCVFQHVEERAVPLLGYLPQDLIGMPVMMHLHPDDQPLMLNIHKKILKNAGQPFEYAPVRFCTQNGEYIIIDTSWSSFVNPWSRKVSFIIGRHKVRRGPLNEDVFAAPGCGELKAFHPEIQTITEQIQRLLLQPVYDNRSSGYGSLDSNGSHAQIIRIASSIDTNGNINEESQLDKLMVVQKAGKDPHTGRIRGQTEFNKIKSRHKTGTQKETSSQTKDVEASTSKGTGTSSAGKNMFVDEPRCEEHSGCCYQQINCLDSVIRYLDGYHLPWTTKRKRRSSSPSDDDKQKANIVNDSKAPLKSAKLMPSGAVVGTPLAPLALRRKAASITSRGSCSSTIVHVGDKKRQADAEILMEDGLGITDPAENMRSAMLVTTASSVNPEKEALKKHGLTKERLAAHTQKEEQIFLTKFKELSKLKPFGATCKTSLQYRHKGYSRDRGSRGFEWNRGEPAHKKSGKNRKPETKRIKQQGCERNTNHRLHPWPTPIIAVIPTYQLPVFPTAGGVPIVTDPSLANFAAQGLHYNPQTPPFPVPLVSPLVAVVLPNFVMSPVPEAVCQSIFANKQPFPSQPNFLPAWNSFQAPPAFALHPRGQPAEDEKPPAPGLQGQQGHTSPLNFHPSSSSPLQLNLLDEVPGSSKAIGLVAGDELMAIQGAMTNNMNGTNVDTIAMDAANLNESHAEAQNNDSRSTSTDMLKLLLQSDIGSVGSGSMESTRSGSPSNGCGMSGTDTGSSCLSSVKYFGSSDSHNKKIDEGTTMTYQLPLRDIETVLKEDREKLKLMQRNQHKFTEKQRQEIAEVFPWFKTGAPPKTIDIMDKIFSAKNASRNILPRMDMEIHNLDISGLNEPGLVGLQVSNVSNEGQKPSEIADPNLAIATNTFGNSAS